MTNHKKFAILITTKDRRDELLLTLRKIADLISRTDTRCIVLDDGSRDQTFENLQMHFPEIEVVRHQKSMGYLHSRNKLLEMANAEYAISLDDDAHFLSASPLAEIEKLFIENPACGLIAFRIFWGKTAPASTKSSDHAQRVQSFVGCGHAWRTSAWKVIPDYPEWFKFYGEEDFASYELFRAGFQVVYAPQILVHHRVDLKLRKNDSDYTRRLRRSLASGWLLYFLFVPLRLVPRKFAASIASQFRTKIFKGNLNALKALLLAFFDLIVAFPKIISNSNRLTLSEYQAYRKLSRTRIFWKPGSEQ
ncbi:MAG TPA: glycosyltransferase [Flavobacterium sp.]|jgi:GT2 family glycosyltransferase